MKETTNSFIAYDFYCKQCPGHPTYTANGGAGWLVDMNFDGTGCVELFLSSENKITCAYLSAENERIYIRVEGENMPADFSPQIAEKYLKRVLSMRAFL